MQNSIDAVGCRRLLDNDADQRDARVHKNHPFAIVFARLPLKKKMPLKSGVFAKQNFMRPKRVA